MTYAEENLFTFSKIYEQRYLLIFPSLLVIGIHKESSNLLYTSMCRTVRYEELYLHDYQTFQEAHDGLGRYFHFYNLERLHETLDYRNPHEVYFGTKAVNVPFDL